ncbi:MAG: chemotaxis-specific protein-glutamate methyltransferase CheB [Isosphaeraceae bacterium]|nr:chemotaxis-specific protein-glutamate methyltransferase CheB [Isosphaeraceae bacterium]
MSSPSRPSPHGPIEVLVVDDSAVTRQRLKSIIESDSRFRVVTAADPYEAVAVLAKSVPGLILLDVEMPRMDGLTFLRKLMSQHPMPVVLCTDQAERAVTALEIGALEVIAKPDWRDPAKMSAWSNTLMESIRTAARAGHLPLREDPAPSPTDARPTADAVLPRVPYTPRGTVLTDRVIAIGVSTGGVQALQQLLPLFPADAPGLVIVQHMPLGFLGALAARLDKDPKIALEVAEGKHLDPIRRGRALLVPSDVHGLVRRTGSGYRIELVDGPKVCIQRPSVEVLFRSTAQAAGPNAAGVIMTGMGDDGAGGLLEMREAGALTIAQNQATCTVFGMPREAIRRRAAQQILPLDRIAAALMAWDAGSDSGSRA